MASYLQPLDAASHGPDLFCDLKTTSTDPRLFLIARLTHSRLPGLIIDSAVFIAHN